MYKNSINNYDIKLSKILKKISKNFKKNLSIADQLDSIQMLDFILSIEKTFKIKIFTENINSKNFFMKSDVIKLIKQNVKNKKPK
jgi:acyl carrier protein